MATFQILYLVPDRAKKYRAAAPAKPPFRLRRAHYTPGPTRAASSPYEVWKTLREGGEDPTDPGVRPLGVGDVLETQGQVLVCHYWGFEPAEWVESVRSGQRTRTEGQKAHKDRAG
ncbi:MAG: hypothetical protein OXN89_16310 [Bryobacterales bacterium]|nr:hypothetical protein [Bryobacterales bacterium]